MLYFRNNHNEYYNTCYTFVFYIAQKKCTTYMQVSVELTAEVTQHICVLPVSTECAACCYYRQIRDEATY